MSTQTIITLAFRDSRAQRAASIVLAVCPGFRKTFISHTRDLVYGLQVDADAERDDRASLVLTILSALSELDTPLPPISQLRRFDAESKREIVRAVEHALGIKRSTP